MSRKQQKDKLDEKTTINAKQKKQIIKENDIKQNEIKENEKDIDNILMQDIISIDTIDNEITNMDKINSLKEKVKMYNELKTKLSLYKNKLMEIKKNIDIITTKECSITDSEYDQITKDLEKVKNNINDNTPIDILIKCYKLSIENIYNCERYLSSKKAEIVYIE